MCDIADLKMQIEEARAEVQESFGRDSYEITYLKNLKLDRLLEKYIELTGQDLQFTPPGASAAPHN